MCELKIGELFSVTFSDNLRPQSTHLFQVQMTRVCNEKTRKMHMDNHIYHTVAFIHSMSNNIMLIDEIAFYIEMRWGEDNYHYHASHYFLNDMKNSNTLERKKMTMKKIFKSNQDKWRADVSFLVASVGDTFISL